MRQDKYWQWDVLASPQRLFCNMRQISSVAYSLAQPFAVMTFL